MSEWVKVTDRLPAEGRQVWVWRPLIEVTDRAYFGWVRLDRAWFTRFDGRELNDVSHWREIDPPPRGPVLTDEEYEALIIEVKAQMKERP